MQLPELPKKPTRTGRNESKYPSLDFLYEMYTTTPVHRRAVKEEQIKMTLNPISQLIIPD